MVKDCAMLVYTPFNGGSVLKQIYRHVNVVEEEVYILIDMLVHLILTLCCFECELDEPNTKSSSVALGWK